MTSGDHMREASETYAGFTNLVKWGAISVAIIAAFVVFLISS